MTVAITSRLVFETFQPTDVLLQFEAAAIPEQRLVTGNSRISETRHFARVPGHDSIGDRIWLCAQGRIEVDYQAEIEVRRVIAEVGPLAAMPTHQLPGGTVQYLLDSRYCHGTRFQSFVEAEFGGSLGGARIVAIRDWISRKIAYVSAISDANTTALDTFVERRGICRDFAHLAVTLARASGIPARYASVYAPGVDPQDFHALAEVFLADPQSPAGSWHLVDATGMADPAHTAKIGVGRDAADVSFLTSFGPVSLLEKMIEVTVES